jgi:hypothetical protein
LLAEIWAQHATDPDRFRDALMALLSPPAGEETACRQE